MDRGNRVCHQPQREFDAVCSSQYFDASTGIGNLDYEHCYPLDAFDRQVLAQHSDELYRPNAETLPQKPFSVSEIDEEQIYRRPIGIDSISNRHESLQRSSSPSFPVSSPTISALQKRHGTKACFGAVSYPTQTTQWSRTTPIVQGIPLVPTDYLPDNLRSVFSFPIFNAVQSRCFSTAFETDNNLVVSAPTGSGKTAIMELTLCRLLLTNRTQDFKVIYQAPTKSLCSERHRDWTKKFGTLGLRCAELTGDVEYAYLKTVQTAHIIVTTPEKWDSVTRKWRDNAKLMGMIKLFMIDEVHILNENRGATLEAIVSRMRSTGSNVRFVALSATVPNSEDIAMWLGRDPSTPHLSAHREVFDESFRPVKLEKHVLGYNRCPNDFALDSLLTKEIPSLIAQYAKRKPTMIFCMTKNSATKTATSLAEMWFSTVSHLRLWDPSPQQIKVMNEDLQKIVSAGVAFHHSGLDVADREAIERGFLHGRINIICSTSTLAVGINLPCYLVILKGTSCWSDHGLQEYSGLEVMQMLGRAGRPQFETSACAVILTHADKVRQYEGLILGNETLESSLHKNLIEHLNAEIDIGTIFDVESAKKWLSSSFLSVRLRQNPGNYRLQGNTEIIDPDRLLEKICERDLKLLDDAQLVSSGGRIQCTENGRAMARYYVQYGTMLAFLKLKEKAKISEILNVLVQAHEFRNLKLRPGEKGMYKQINKANDIRYPIDVDIALPSHKVSLIIQAHLGGIILDKSNAKHSTQFKQDILMVINHCNRLIRCIIDMQIHQQDAVAVKNALELCRSIAAGVWDNTPMQLKQIESIDDVTARKLAAAGISTIDALLSTEPQRIEVVLGKSQPFGANLLKKASRFPSLHISVKEIDRVREHSTQSVNIRLKCDIGNFNESLPIFFNRKAVFICFLCQTSYGKLVDFRRFSAKHMAHGEQILLTALVDKPCYFISCHVMCDEIAGTYRYAELKVNIPNMWFASISSHNTTTEMVDKRFLSHAEVANSFDDGGIIDEDFLTVESNIEKDEVAERNTKHTLTSGNQDKIPSKNLKRKQPSCSGGSDRTALSKIFRETRQLANGNWTCQHNCNEEGKECKHQCCKDGVKKPKKRAKTQTIKSRPDMKVESLLTAASGSLDSSKGNQIHDIDEILGTIADNYKTSTEQRELSAKISEPSIMSSVKPKHTSISVEYDEKNTFELDSDDLPTTEEIVKNFVSQDTTYGDRLDQQKANKEQEAVDTHNVGGRHATSTRMASLLSGSDPNNADLFCQSPRNFRKGPNDCGDTKPVTKDTISNNPAETALVISNRCPDKPVYIPNEAISDDFGEIDYADLLALENGHTTMLQANIGSHVKELPALAYDNTAITEPRPSDIGTVQHKTSYQVENEKRRMLHQETQGEKWARLPAWMYETYGAYVNIL